MCQMLGQIPEIKEQIMMTDSNEEACFNLNSPVLMSEVKNVISGARNASQAIDFSDLERSSLQTFLDQILNSSGESKGFIQSIN